jgi:TonB family protein
MRTFSLYLILAIFVLAACGEPAHGQRPENPRHYYYQISPSNAPLKTEEAIYSPRPDYPIKAKQRHLTGSGLFAVHIRADGRVVEVKVLRSTGHSELDQGAIKSLREWQFPPRSIRVVRVPIRYVVGPVPKHIIPLPLKNPGDGADIGIFYNPR